MPEDPVLREVIRQLGELATRLEAVSNRLETTYVRKDVFDAHKETAKAKQDDLANDVKELQDWQKWIQRLVIGAVALAVLGLVLARSTGGAP